MYPYNKCNERRQALPAPLHQWEAPVQFCVYTQKPVTHIATKHVKGWPSDVFPFILMMNKCMVLPAILNIFRCVGANWHDAKGRHHCFSWQRLITQPLSCGIVLITNYAHPSNFVVHSLIFVQDSPY